jgi:hypothetical protein
MLGAVLVGPPPSLQGGQRQPAPSAPAWGPAMGRTRSWATAHYPLRRATAAAAWRAPLLPPPPFTHQPAMVRQHLGPDHHVLHGGRLAEPQVEGVHVRRGQQQLQQGGVLEVAAAQLLLLPVRPGLDQQGRRRRAGPPAVEHRRGGQAAELLSGQRGACGRGKTRGRGGDKGGGRNGWADVGGGCESAARPRLPAAPRTGC